MRRSVFLICFILLYKLGFSQSANRFAAVDSFVQHFPMKINASGDLRVFIREMSRTFTSDEERVRAVYFWITENISYDYAAYYSEALRTVEIDDILKSRKAVCAGYAALIQFGCDVMNVECKTILGVARGHVKDIFIHPDSLKTNHAWNAVRLNGEWKLIDATWASGYSDIAYQKFSKKRKDAYFFMRPACFIYDHLPDDSSWQLLKDSIITKNLFCNRPFIWYSYFENQIESTVPFILRLNKRVGDTIKFEFCTTKALDKIIVYSDEKPVIRVIESLLKKEDCYFYNYVVRHAGKYDLNIGFSSHNYDKVPGDTSRPDSYSTALQYRLEAVGKKPQLLKTR